MSSGLTSPDTVFTDGFGARVKMMTNAPRSNMHLVGYVDTGITFDPANATDSGENQICTMVFSATPVC